MKSKKSVPAGRIASPVDMNPVDAFVGRRLTVSREAAGIMVEGLSGLLGIDAGTFHAYELGFLTVPEEVLYAVSKIVRVPMRFFFDLDSEEVAA